MSGVKSLRGVVVCALLAALATGAAAAPGVTSSLGTSTLTVREGGTSTYALVLDEAPSAAVTISSAISGDADLRITAGASLVFSATTWSVAQNIAVFARPDDDHADGTASIAHAASSADAAYHGISIAAAAVAENDDDTAGYTLSLPLGVQVLEGRTGGYSVALDAAPTAPVVIDVSRRADSDADLRIVAGAALTFSASDWSTPQSVVLTAVADADEENGTATLFHIPRSDDAVYAGLASTTLTVWEGESAGICSRSPAVIDLILRQLPDHSACATVTESDLAVVSFLNFWPLRPNVGPLKSGDFDGLVNLTSVDFARNNQMRRIPADLLRGRTKITDTLYMDDLGLEEAAPEMLHGLTNVAGIYIGQERLNRLPQDIFDGMESLASLLIVGQITGLSCLPPARNNLTENRGLPVCTGIPSVKLSRTWIELGEGQSDAYALSLRTEPAAAVTIAVARHGDADISASPAALTFTTTDWSVGQTVSVSAGDDADDLDGEADFRHAASSADPDYHQLPVRFATVVEQDDDPVVRFAASPAQLRVLEDGPADAYTLSMSAPPAAEVLVVASANNGFLLAGDPSETPGTSVRLKFTTADWSVARTIAVSRPADGDGADATGAVTHATYSQHRAWNGAAVGSVSLSELDRSTKGVVLSQRAVTVPEGGTATYALLLSATPSGPVTVEVSRKSGDSSVSVTGGAALTFAVDDWSAARRVTLTAAQDGDGASGTSTIGHAASSADAGYHGIAIADMTAAEADDDAPGIRAEPSSVAVPEGGTAAYAVTLATEPLGAVTVTASRASGDADLSVSGPSRLTFATSTWRTPQTVTLSAAQDGDDVAGTATFAHSATSSDAAYGAGLAAAPVSATEADDESVGGIELSATGVRVAEAGGTATFAVHLDSRPLASVTVSATSTDASVAAISGTLTFAMDDYSTAQTLTATGVDDFVDNVPDRVAAIALSASGPGYDGATSSLAATAVDDDAAGIVLSTRLLEVPEGGSATYAAMLASEPTADVRILRSGVGDEHLALSGDLTFTASNWSAAQTFTVSALEDADGDNGSAAISHAALGADAVYAALSPVSLTATERDNDRPDVLLSVSPPRIAEGGMAQVAARLPAATSTADIVLAVSSSDARVRIGGARRLTIPAGGTESLGAVPATAADDAIDGDDFAAQIAAAATTTAPAGVHQPAAAVLTVLDDDVRGIELSATGVRVAENGGTSTYRVRLTSEPTAAVTVTAASADDSVAVVSGSLTFAASEWSVWRTATVAGVDDDIDNPGDRRVAAIRHAAAGGDYGSETAALSAEAADDDTAGLAFAPARLSVPVGGTSSYAVALATRPLAAVTLRVSVADTSAASRIRVAGPSLLTIAEAEWDAPRTVVVADEAFVDRHEPARILHAASGGGYGGIFGAVEAAHAPLFERIAGDRIYARGSPIAPLELPSAVGGLGALAYALSPALPEGLAFDAASLRISGTPSRTQPATEYALSATDEGGLSGVLTFRIAVTVAVGNGGGGTDVLRFDGAEVPSQSYAVGRAIAPLELPAAVGGSAPVRYALLDAPPGLVFDPSARTLSGTPTEARAERSYAYRATDATGAIATLRIAIAVAANAVPDFGGALVPARTLVVGRAASIPLPAASGGDGELSYALSPALPAGLAFDAASRTVSGTPEALLRPTVFVLSATDGNGDAAELEFAIEVVEPPQEGEDAARRFLRGWRIALPALPRDDPMPEDAEPAGSE